MSNNTIVDVIVRQPMSSQQISSYIAVPVGGSSGQVLAKASNATGDLVWITNSAASGTDLTITSKTSTQFTLVSSSGADVAIPQATISEAGLLIATDKVKLNSLATVATSGSYADLTGTPTIPAAQAVSTPVTQNVTFCDFGDASIYVNPSEFIQLCTRHIGTVGTAGTVVHRVTYIYGWE